MSTKVRCVSSSIHVSASPAEVFAMLSDPDQHRLFDGSGMVRSSRSGTSSLELGSKLGMNMKLGPIPYRMNNTV
ncbi:MAG: dimethyladenosine transferase, partial [Ilumatobacteraceae bacterium]